MASSEYGPGALPDEPSDAESKLRAKASLRAWLCVGGGFALMGQRGLAVVTFLSSVAIPAAIVWWAFDPSPAVVGSFLAIVLIASILWAAEQVVAKRAPLAPPGPSFLVAGFIPATCLFWLGVVAAIGVWLASFGSLLMNGTGMTPTLMQGEHVIYHKHVDWQRLKRGTVIVYMNSRESTWGRPESILVSRILAEPGDTLAIDGGRYVVNGIATRPISGTGRFTPVLHIPTNPDVITVPADYYFVVQDSPYGGLDSRVLWWVPRQNVLGTRLWRTGTRGMLQRVE